MQDIDEFEIYKVVYKNRLIKELKNLELPPSWGPKDVIDFVISRIERIS
jgi:hypothetical protein